jgi:hypothetical protein
MPRYELPAPALIAGNGLWKANHVELTHMFDQMFETDFARRVRKAMLDADPVLQLARARQHALAAWGEAQEEADCILATLPPGARGDPQIEETSGYAAAYERSMRLLDPLLEIEDRLEEARATTLAGLLIQAKLLEAALPSSGHAGGRLLASIIASLEEMTDLAG